MVLKNKEVIYQWLLSESDDGWYSLLCDDYPLIEQIQSDFGVGSNIFLRYYITDKPVTLEEVMTAFVIRCVGGDITELSYKFDAYSEWTIIEEEEDFVVWGHDLVEELNTYIGKFLTLIIEEKVYDNK